MRGMSLLNLGGKLEKYFMTLDVKPEIAGALEALAFARGLSVEDYLEQLVENQLPLKLEDTTGSLRSLACHFGPASLDQRA